MSIGWLKAAREQLVVDFRDIMPTWFNARLPDTDFEVLSSFRS